MPRRPHEPRGWQEREDGAAWMAEPLSEARIHAAFGDSLAADSARALVAAQVSLDDLLLSRNLHHELRAMGIEPWGDRQRVISFALVLRPNLEHGAHKRKRAKLRRKCAATQIAGSI